MPIKRINGLLPLAALAFGLMLTGCDSGSPEDDNPSIGGMYTGAETSEGTTATFSLEIPSTSSGSFALGNDSEVSTEVNGITISVDIEGDGTYDFPDIAMTLSYEIEGEQYTSGVDGTVSSSGDILRLEDSDGEELTFTRQ